MAIASLWTLLRLGWVAESSSSLRASSLLGRVTVVILLGVVRRGTSILPTALRSGRRRVEVAWLTASWAKAVLLRPIEAATLVAWPTESTLVEAWALLSGSSCLVWRGSAWRWIASRWHARPALIHTRTRPRSDSSVHHRGRLAAWSWH